MNPVVLIATHERVEVTKQNIYSLMMQSIQPKIVLVVSENEELEYFQKKFPELYIYKHENDPLGAKWQYGVDMCKELKPDPLIITGSDDILGIDFVEIACNMMKEVDFIGLYRWHVFNDGMLYLCKYNTHMPLGGGRCYSLRLLDKINYELFDWSRNRRLDDYGWESVRKSGLKKKLITSDEGLNIVSIKGNWQMLNPFEKFNNSKNVTILSKSRDINELHQLINYDTKRVL